MVIVKPHGIDTTRFDIRNALFGDVKVNLFGKPQFGRGGDRIFAKNKNKRVSAVIYYEKRYQESGYVKKKLVYHNQYANIKLSAEIFKGENVTQYIPTYRNDGSIYYEKTI